MNIISLRGNLELNSLIVGRWRTLNKTSSLCPWGSKVMMGPISDTLWYNPWVILQREACIDHIILCFTCAMWPSSWEVQRDWFQPIISCFVLDLISLLVSLTRTTFLVLVVHTTPVYVLSHPFTHCQSVKIKLL